MWVQQALQPGSVQLHEAKQPCQPFVCHCDDIISRMAPQQQQQQQQQGWAQSSSQKVLGRANSYVLQRHVLQPWHFVLCV
jgi:hypothetical protein